MSYVHLPSERSSWHSLMTYTRAGGALTRCGRFVPGPNPRVVDALPLDERSCESCLRLAIRDGERGPDSPSGELPS
jgi:hypothetical protein